MQIPNKNYLIAGLCCLLLAGSFLAYQQKPIFGKGWLVNPFSFTTQSVDGRASWTDGGTTTPYKRYIKYLCNGQTKLLEKHQDQPGYQSDGQCSTNMQARQICASLDTTLWGTSCLEKNLPSQCWDGIAEWSEECDLWIYNWREYWCDSDCLLNDCDWRSCWERLYLFELHDQKDNSYIMWEHNLMIKEIANYRKINYNIFKDISKISQQECYINLTLDKPTTLATNILWNIIPFSCQSNFPYTNNIVKWSNLTNSIRYTYNYKKYIMKSIEDIRYDFVYKSQKGYSILFWAGNNGYIQKNYCTDWILDSDKWEECDDGNEIDTDSCGNDCKKN